MTAAQAGRAAVVAAPVEEEVIMLEEDTFA